MVRINGVNLEVAGSTLAQYLETANYEPKQIVVELNEEIIPKTQYSQTVLQDGDIVEVISFMGGG